LAIKVILKLNYGFIQEEEEDFLELEVDDELV
jgi:hypothetical protein